MPDAALMEAVREVLASPEFRSRSFSVDYQDLVDKHDAQLQGLLSDRNIGMSQNGPVWMDGVSVIDGTITADKLIVNSLEAITTSTGSLNVTGTATLAASFPATGQRIELNSAGVKGYNSSLVNTFKLNTDGSGFVGVGATAMSWTTAGVVTIPVASIGSLTIAAVGGGVLGGTYQTAATGAHINLSTTGIVVYNATSEISANETFKLLAATGAMTATGSFTIKSAASGSHVTMDNAGGIAGYNSTTESASFRTFLINAADGSGHLGLSTGTNISWDATGSVSIPGSLLVNGTVTAGKISTSTLAAISADLGTITAGTINASNVTVTNLSFAHIQQTGTLGASQNFGTNSMQINGTGKLLFGTGGADYLSNNILHFDISSGTEDAKVEFQNGSNTPKAKLSSLMTSTRALVSMNAVQNGANIRGWMKVDAISSGTEIHLHSSKDESSDIADFYLESGGAAPYARIDIGGNPALLVESTNRRTRLYGYLYPGTGSATQATDYITYVASPIQSVRVPGDFTIGACSQCHCRYLGAPVPCQTRRNT